MEEGILFVIDGKQVFLPFTGYLLSKANERELAPVHLISFLTQKMLLTAIYERWNGVKVEKQAGKLAVLFWNWDILLIFGEKDCRIL